MFITDEAAAVAAEGPDGVDKAAQHHVPMQKPHLQFNVNLQGDALSNAQVRTYCLLACWPSLQFQSYPSGDALSSAHVRTYCLLVCRPYLHLSIKLPGDALSNARVRTYCRLVYQPRVQLASSYQRCIWPCCLHLTCLHGREPSAN